LTTIVVLSCLGIFIWSNDLVTSLIVFPAQMKLFTIIVIVKIKPFGVQRMPDSIYILWCRALFTVFFYPVLFSIFYSIYCGGIH